MPSLKQVFHKTINKLGWKLLRYPKGEYLLDRLIRNTKDFNFVQIGANDGIRFDNLYSKVTSNRLPGLVVEALPDFYQRLQTNYADYPEVIPVNMAIHGTETSLVIYRVAPEALKRLPDWVAGIASFKKGHIESHGVGSNDVLEQQVGCAPLMEIVKKYNFLNATYLQSDTEGFDAEIIKMIDFNIFKPLMIKYESLHLSQGEKNYCLTKLQAEGYHVFDEGMDTVAYIESNAFN